MTLRTEKLNEQFKGELANLILEYLTLDNALITVSFVDCSPDLKNAKVGISVLPDNMFGTALKKLNSHNKEFAQILKKKLSLKTIPKFSFVADTREKYAAEIDDIINQIHKEDE